MTRSKHKVGKGHDTSGAALVFRHAKAVEDERVGRPGIPAGRLPYEFRAYTCDLLHLLWRMILHMLPHMRDIFTPGLKKFTVFKPLVKYCMKNGIYKRDICSWFKPEPYPPWLFIGYSSNVSTPGVNNDKICTAARRLPDLEPDDRMGLCGIGTTDKQEISTCNLRKRRCCRTASKCCQQTADRGSVSDPGTVIHIIGANGSTRKLLEQVVLLVCAS